jgi:hypothetical protein
MLDDPRLESDENSMMKEMRGKLLEASGKNWYWKVAFQLVRLRRAECVAIEILNPGDQRSIRMIQLLHCEQFEIRNRLNSMKRYIQTKTTKPVVEELAKSFSIFTLVKTRDDCGN